MDSEILISRLEKEFSLKIEQSEKRILRKIRETDETGRIKDRITVVESKVRDLGD